MTDAIDVAHKLYDALRSLRSIIPDDYAGPATRDVLIRADNALALASTILEPRDDFQGEQEPAE